LGKFSTALNWLELWRRARNHLPEVKGLDPGKSDHLWSKLGRGKYAAGASGCHIRKRPQGASLVQEGNVGS
ncbi:hypothetical protein, partial [Streptococcus pneumoniae]|uniref:hypothetical protein n=1 Tax=Streptococcus pneumoniae TaxID=1313 RepID=UPI0019533DBC